MAPRPTDIGADGRVGLQSRATSPYGDQASPWPDPQGGAGGTIDIPSRENPSEPSTPPYAPTAASGIGVGPTPSVSGYHPPVDFGYYGRWNATPHAIFALHYIRRFVSSGAAVLAEYVPPKPATVAGTLNMSAEEGGPVSPIPVFRRFLVMTLAEPFGWGRIWNLNLAPPDVQKPAAVRRMLSRQALPRMGAPMFPSLTRLATVPAGTVAADQVLTPSGNVGAAPNPYAAGG